MNYKYKTNRQTDISKLSFREMTVLYEEDITQNTGWWDDTKTAAGKMGDNIANWWSPPENPAPVTNEPGAWDYTKSAAGKAKDAMGTVVQNAWYGSPVDPKASSKQPSDDGGKQKLDQMEKDTLDGKGPFAQQPTSQSATTTTPPTSADKPQQASGGDYNVASGDNLWKIARKQLGSGTSNQVLQQYVNKIASTNNLANPDLIFPGQKLKMPDSASTNNIDDNNAAMGASVGAQPSVQKQAPRQAIHQQPQTNQPPQQTQNIQPEIDMGYSKFKEKYPNAKEKDYYEYSDKINAQTQQSTPRATQIIQTNKSVPQDMSMSAGGLHPRYSGPEWESFKSSNPDLAKKIMSNDIYAQQQGGSSAPIAPIPQNQQSNNVQQTPNRSNVIPQTNQQTKTQAAKSKAQSKFNPAFNDITKNPNYTHAVSLEQQADKLVEAGRYKEADKLRKQAKSFYKKAKPQEW